MSNLPLINVVMPVYNGELFISGAIESILNQNYDNWELIIVNDGSTDNTESVVKKYLTYKNISYYKHDLNRGIAYTYNTVFSLCTGKYVAIQDSDDISLPDRLSNALTRGPVALESSCPARRPG